MHGCRRGDAAGRPAGLSSGAHPFLRPAAGARGARVLRRPQAEALAEGCGGDGLPHRNAAPREPRDRAGARGLSGRPRGRRPAGGGQTRRPGGPPRARPLARYARPRPDVALSGYGAVQQRAEAGHRAPAGRDDLRAHGRGAPTGRDGGASGDVPGPLGGEGVSGPGAWAPRARRGDAFGPGRPRPCKPPADGGGRGPSRGTAS